MNINQSTEIAEPLLVTKKQGEMGELTTSFLDIPNLLWGFVGHPWPRSGFAVPLPAVTGLESGKKVAELAIIEPRALLRAVSNATPFIGRVVNPSLPLFPQIQDVSRPLFLRNLFWAPRVLNLFIPYLLPFLAFVAIGGGVVYFVKVNSKPTVADNLVLTERGEG